MADFDDRTVCPYCGASVRVLGMDAHQHGAECRTHRLVAEARMNGMAPLPDDLAGEMMDFIRSLGIEVEYGVVGFDKQRQWKPYRHGWLAPEWVTVVLHAYRQNSLPQRAVEGLHALTGNEEAQTEIIVLHRLGGETAVRHRLRELVDERQKAR